MQFNDPNNKGKCATCGKEVAVRDVRNKKAVFCGRICAANMRYRTRYRGSNSGPFDKPDNFKDKTKWQG